MLILYDENENKITNENIDTFKIAIKENETKTNTKTFYIKTDKEIYIYKNITIEAINEDSTIVSISYSTDGVDFNEPLNLDDGKYLSLTSIDRKIEISQTSNKFEFKNIEHQITTDRYVLNAAIDGRAAFEQFTENMSKSFPIYIRGRIKGTLLFRGRQFSQDINNGKI